MAPSFMGAERGSHVTRKKIDSEPEVSRTRGSLHRAYVYAGEKVPVLLRSVGRTLFAHPARHFCVRPEPHVALGLSVADQFLHDPDT